MMNTTTGLGAIWVIPAFALAWAWARKINNYSLVDALWAYAIGITAVSWLAFGEGDPWKRLAAACMVAFWSLRLGWHLQRRIQHLHPQEDARYAKLREHWAGREAGAFFWFYQSQALSVLLLALPFLFIARDRSTWSPWESAGIALALCGIFGEALADHQMSAFKKSNTDAKAVCRNGLWSWSRHPNYFFESVIWIGFYVFACGSTYGWAALHAPVTIIYLLLRVTGIPATEASALARKGEAYREYQRSTSAFIPLPPKSASHP